MVIASQYDLERKIYLPEGIQGWLDNHIDVVNRYAAKNVAYRSRQEFIDFCLNEGRYYAYMVMKNEKRGNYRKLLKVIHSMHSRRGRLDLVVGGRGDGKTAYAFHMAYYLHLFGEKIAYFGPPVTLPPFIKYRTLDFNSLPEGCTVLVDEAGLQYAARDSSNLDQTSMMKKMSTIMRQRNMNFIVITQHLKLFDINFIRTANSLTFKSFSNIQADNAEKHRYRIHQDLRLFMPLRKERALYIDNRDIISFKLTLEPWWDEAYSYPYRQFASRGEAYKFMAELLPELDDAGIVEQMDYKGWPVTELEVRQVRNLAAKVRLDLINLARLERQVDMGFNDAPIDWEKRPHTACNFTMRPVQEDIWRQKLSLNRQLAEMMQYNYNDRFLEELRHITRNEQNVILSIAGLPGSGKSSAAMAVAKLLYSLAGKPFTPNVFFRREELLNAISEMKDRTRQTVILDENIMSFGAGSMRETQELQNMEETLRKRQINFIHCSPTVKTRTHYYVLETAGLDSANKALKLLVSSPDGITLGYITTGMPDAKTWGAYQSLKEEKSLQPAEQRMTSSKEYLLGYAKKVVKNPRWPNCRTKDDKYTLITDMFPQLSGSEQVKVLSYISIYSLE